MVRRGVGVAIAVVVLAGCGGSSDEEKVIEAMKQFKSAALNTTRASCAASCCIPTPCVWSSAWRAPRRPRAALRRRARRASALERRASSRLADLKPPPDLERIYRETLSTLNGLGATLRAQSAAIGRGDVRGAGHAVGRLQTLDFRKSAGFLRLGVPACAEL